jgi:hypothetical protein
MNEQTGQLLPTL